VSIIRHNYRAKGTDWVANWRSVLLTGFESTKVATPDNRNDNEQVKKTQQQQTNKTRGKV
jgi:hypothetical protein